MDITQIQNLVGWLIGILSTSILAIVVGVFNIVRSGRLAKREVKEKDLTNEEKEVDVAKAWKGLAAETARETLEVNKRIKDLEDKLEIQEDTIKRLEAKITEQNQIIENQNIRIGEQDRTIRILEGKLADAEADNKALMEQLIAERITPKVRKRQNGNNIQ